MKHNYQTYLEDFIHFILIFFHEKTKSKAVTDILRLMVFQNTVIQLLNLL